MEYRSGREYRRAKCSLVSQLSCSFPLPVCVPRWCRNDKRCTKYIPCVSTRESFPSPHTNTKSYLCKIAKYTATKEQFLRHNTSRGVDAYGNVIQSPFLKLSGHIFVNTGIDCLESQIESKAKKNLLSLDEAVFVSGSPDQPLKLLERWRLSINLNQPLDVADNCVD